MCAYVSDARPSGGDERSLTAGGEDTNVVSIDTGRGWRGELHPGPEQLVPHNGDEAPVLPDFMD